MNRRFTPAGFAKHMEMLAIEAEPKLVGVAEVVVTSTREHIESVIGKNPPLAELKSSTIAKKENAGYRYPEAPLIATGAYLHSFETDVLVIPGVGVAAGVGTEDEKALYHELGTSKMVPRPAVSIGASQAEPANEAIFVAGAQLIADGKAKLPVKFRKGKSYVSRG